MFKTTIREWMLIVVIVAVATCWWVDQTRLHQRILRSENTLSETRQALAVSETAREDAVRANGMIVDLMRSWGFGVHLPEEVYVARRPGKQ